MASRAFLLLFCFLVITQAEVAEAGQASKKDAFVSQSKNLSLQANHQRKSSVAKWVEQSSQVRALPGFLDRTLVLNSNSPEIVYRNSILVSTFPSRGKKTPAAHLNFPISGDFDVFAHHIAKPDHGNVRTLYLGLIIHNPGTKPVTVSVRQAASCATKFDAPYVKLPDFAENPRGSVFSGPGDRLTDFILRGGFQAGFPRKLTLAPGEYKMLFSLPVSNSQYAHTNCRSTLIKANASGNIYGACLAMRAPSAAKGGERAPALAEWKNLLFTGSLATPRDRAPTDPKSTRKVIYGRVAGVSRGAPGRLLFGKIRPDVCGSIYLSRVRPILMFSVRSSREPLEPWIIKAHRW